MSTPQPTSTPRFNRPATPYKNSPIQLPTTPPANQLAASAVIEALDASGDALFGSAPPSPTQQKPDDNVFAMDQ